MGEGNAYVRAEHQNAICAWQMIPVYITLYIYMPHCINGNEGVCDRNWVMGLQCNTYTYNSV